MSNRMFTKEHIRKVISLWSTKGTTEIADEMGLKPIQVTYLAKVIRDSGYHLPKKLRRGLLNSLVREVLVEEGLISSTV